jgi:hypothetical protein
LRVLNVHIIQTHCLKNQHVGPAERKYEFESSIKDLPHPTVKAELNSILITDIVGIVMQYYHSTNILVQWRRETFVRICQHPAHHSHCAKCRPRFFIQLERDWKITD